ncbi:hypothetical protein HBH81_164280 [Parastagonospora nodorum]|nr:hypothetical protein HBH81_164280 [Parastagonospora nodorum]
MSQTNIREEYRIITLEVVELIEDLISYTMMLAKVRQYSAKVKIENLSNTLILTLSKTAQRRSSSVMSNRSIALITDKFGVALLTEPAILNDANVALVDAVIDALMMTLIKDDDDLLGTVNSYIKLRRLRARCKTEAADSRYAKASGGRTKKDKDLEDSDTSSDVLRLCRRDRAAARARLAERKHLLDSDDYRSDSSSDINSKDNLEDKEAMTAKDLSLCKSRDSNRTLHSRRVDFSCNAYILYFKELLSDNSGIFANAMSIGKTRAIVLAVLIGHCDLSDLLALRFCFFSDSLLENISRLTKEEAIEMRINTTNAISKALAAANKLVALQSYVLGGFVIVCGFRKVDKHVFRAYNTISVTAQQIIIRKGGSYIEKRAILLSSYVTFNATNKRDSITSDRIYKIEDARNIIANVKHDASEHKSSYKDILEKEGLNELEASRRVIFNCFEM